MELKCAICNENQKKYKCKTCEVPYCSLACYKSHQETPCEAPPKTDSPLIQEDRNQPQRTYLYTTVDTVDPAMLEQLRHSDPLKDLLYNPHLRRLLQEIDAAPDAMKAVRVAMMEPLFVEFADQCLRVVEPANANETHDQTLLNS
ncbi:zinc finger HIT domain-containing protein 3 [Culex quinquefasciatus]|uniref:zinc finger HIT domain-containing protein 3 n=1 Tax=Culex quinquefasciatus TaxID=7176 RepID=UPI0018E35F8C|nr:zinc finger HIT domain-containing protein 3 [Culex quinquefasciatus]